MREHLYRFGVAQCLALQPCQIVSESRILTLNPGHIGLGLNPVFIWNKLAIYWPIITHPEVAFPILNFLPQWLHQSHYFDLQLPIPISLGESG